MRLFARGPELPGPVRAAVPGRPLAAARSQEDAWLVGTRESLHVIGANGEVQLSLPWQRVQRADWDSEHETLRLDPVADFGEIVPRREFGLPDAGSLLALVRERVSASVVVQRRVELERRRGLTVIGRRSPTGQGPIAWAYELDEGVDPADPAVLSAADSALRDARESLGL